MQSRISSATASGVSASSVGNVVSSTRLRNNGVSTAPGFRVNARTPLSAYSAMIDRVNESSPDLLAAYAVK